MTRTESMMINLASIAQMQLAGEILIEIGARVSVLCDRGAPEDLAAARELRDLIPVVAALGRERPSLTQLTEDPACRGN